MPSILHISDLHRTSKPCLGNDELLAAIFSDAQRWDSEGIPKPELIVVSGDLIQGPEPGASDPDFDIDEQYREASMFLQNLAKEFVDSDHSKVIIVPGNHDVNWSSSFNSMKPINDIRKNLGTRVYDAKSSLRWDWIKCQTYEIKDAELYETRFEAFRQFRTEFYKDVEPSPFKNEIDDILFFDYPNLGIVVVGFSSCYGNDCFCHVGDIDPSSLSLSQRLLKDSESSIAVAVWHHGILGGPRSHDYMDQRVVHKLVDFGFNIGMHGHQHYADAAPFDLRLPNLTSMVLIGAGSLSVGDGELPMGEPRQFNIVVIDSVKKRITVHVRSMSASGVFSGYHRNDFGGKTSIELELPTVLMRSTKVTSEVKLLDMAMAALALDKPREALELVNNISDSCNEEKRVVEIEALSRLECPEKLIDLLTPPRNVDELCRLVSLLIDLNMFDNAIEQVQASSKTIDSRQSNELLNTIEAKRKAHEFK